MLKRLVDRLGTTHIAGIDLGSAKLKIVELTRAEGHISLRRCVIVDTISDGPLLAQVLTEAGVSTRNVAIGIASPELIVKPLQFPHMPKKELASAIRLEAEQAILNGHTVAEMATDWHALPSHAHEDVRGLLAVTPKSLIAERTKLFAAAGLRPVVIDVEGLALWNAYWTLVGAQEAADRTVLLMNVGAQTTNLVVVKGQQELLLMRDLRFGAVALGAGQGSDWSAEIYDSLAYARASGGLRTLDAVYVTGGGSGPNLISLLRSAVAAPVTFWNPLQQLKHDPLCPPVDPSVGPMLAIAIGLALRQHG